MDAKTIPFFYMHAEAETVKGDETTNGKTTTTTRHTTTLSIFGKGVSGETVLVRIHWYRLYFYVSFRDRQLCKHCCLQLLKNDPDHTLVVGIKAVTDFKSMTINKNHQTGDAHDYGNTTLTNVVRIHVRNKSDVRRVVGEIDSAAYEYYVQNGSCDEYFSAVQYYESNLDPLVLATRRLGLEACRWCRLDGGSCRKTDNPTFHGSEYEFYDTGKTDPACLFFDTEDASGPPTLPPAVKVLSFDIECLSSVVDKMPDAERDPIIQVSSVVTSDALGCTAPAQTLRRYLFTLGGSCGDVEGAVVAAFAEEKEMLRAFADHVYSEDPDIVTGYNINNFDLPYLFRRYASYGVAAPMGRGRVAATCEKREGNQDRRYASFMPKTHDTRIYGRIILDMYTRVRKEVGLRSYTLNDVASHFLDKRKEDVGYKEIPALFRGGPESRARLGRYCVKDSELVLELAFKTQAFVQSFEQCKVFRTMPQYLYDRGQQVKFYSMLLAWCKEQRILVDDLATRVRMEGRRRCSVAYEADSYAARRPTGPRLGEKRKKKKGDTSDRTDEGVCKRTKKCGRGTTECGRKDGESNGGGDGCNAGSSGKEEEMNEERSASVAVAVSSSGVTRTKRTGAGRVSGYEGATVLEPVAGIYHTPVLCLDYASLYPSIMIGYNLCFTTWVSDPEDGRKLVEKGLAERSPVGHVFLTRGAKKGVLPSVLEMLIDERADVRARMKHSAAGSLEHKLLDGQQYALKIAANSIYGAIGCDKSGLYLVAIPSSVTAYGRSLIMQTKRLVEECFEGTRVVYGDTDSVMVNLTDWDTAVQRVGECRPLGEAMAASVTSDIDRKPIRLQFETVYMPFLLFTKKRYAAGVYGDLDKAAAAGEEYKPKITYKGLQVVRRDNCTLATRLQRFTLESLMTVDAASVLEHITRHLRAELTALFEGTIDTAELVISKEWKKESANAQPHDRLARRMRERDPNSAPSIGDRVPYVVVVAANGPATSTKLCDRAEDPRYVAEKGLALDLLYYADNQVATPIAKLLGSVLLRGGPSVDEIKDSFWPDNAPRRQSDKRRTAGAATWTTKAALGSRRITDFFKTS